VSRNDRKLIAITAHPGVTPLDLVWPPQLVAELRASHANSRRWRESRGA